jgi:hypothetical protein
MKTAAASIVLLLCGALAPQAAASVDPGALAYRQAIPWPALQTADGRFQDYVSGRADGHGRYGEAMLGYALLRTGLREADARLIDAGLGGLAFALAHPERQAIDLSVFEMYALAAAYNLVTRRLADDPRVAGLLPAWTLRLMSERPKQLRGPRRFWNKSIVEAVAVLELLRTGLRSPVPRAWLHDRRSARRRVRRHINRTVPAVAPRRGGTVALSDPPAHPPAYQALSLGFYARAIRLLGDDARPQARATLRRAARTSLLLTAPDGDLAYVGRSQEQAWTLPFTAYGAEIAARSARPRRAARLRALARRALARLESAYAVGATGLAIVPALSNGTRAWYPGIDGYAAAPPYAGLTIVALEAVDGLGVARRPGRRIASDGALAAVTAGGASELAVLRRGRAWLAVRRARWGPDLRYDFGLVGFKWHDSAGWHDVVPQRARAQAASLGPTLVLDGVEHEPAGRRMRARRRAIVVRGGFSGVRGAVRFRWAPAGCGVKLRFRGPPLATYRYSAFFPAGAAPRAEGEWAVAGPGQRIAVSAAATLALTPGFSSAVEPELVRTDLTFAAGASGRVAILTCPN